MDKSERLGRIQGRSPAVDFIDVHLPRQDSAFLNAPSAFDTSAGRYLPVIPAPLNKGSAIQSTTTGSLSRPQTPPDQSIVSNHTLRDVDVQSMRFWDNIFAEGMSTLFTESEEPKDLIKSGGGIRNASGWKEVCFRLNKAQNKYTDEEGTAGTLRRMRRKFADNFSHPAAQIAKMVPDIDPWTTPVVGTVGIMLQAMTIAAKARNEILTAIGDLDKTFSNINSLAATFPKDYDVRQASVVLVAAIFRAVELAIAFFIKNSVRKVAAAILAGPDYQKELLDSFGEVQKRSQYLIQKAQNSHYEGTRAAMQEILTREDQILAGQAEGAKRSAEIKNWIHGFFQVYERHRELDREERKEEQRKRDEMQKQQEESIKRQLQESITVVHHFQIVPRSVSPLPAPLALLPPPPAPYTSPMPTMPSLPTWTAQALRQLLDAPDVSASDLLRVRQLDHTLSQKDKKKADRVVQTDLFRQWILSLKPAKFLIHGDFRGCRTVSPLSLLAATLNEAARADPTRFVTLVFFCACHADPEEDAFTGGRALMQALISQFLQQQPHVNISPPPWDFNPEGARQGDLQQLCHLFSLLVHNLPNEITLFCFIDGMVIYERDEFVADAQFVLLEILRLFGDPTVQANIKLLITSPWRSVLAHQFFQEESEVLHMQGMPSVELTPSSSRVIHRYMSHSDSEPSRESSPDSC